MKSIPQMYADEVKAHPKTSYGPHNPLASLRLQTELHVQFWWPIAEMLNPSGVSTKSGEAALEFYTRDSAPLDPSEIQQSLARMKRLLSTPQLTFNVWLQLRPIFRDLLSDAMTKDDGDLVVCAVREFVRLTLGQPADDAYGLVDPDPSAIYVDGPWYDRSDVADWFCLHDQREQSWSDCDWIICFATQALENLLGDSDAFATDFPGCAKHRLNLLRALRPIFDHASVTNWWVTEDVLPYVKALMAVDFGETLLHPRAGSVLTEAA